MDEQNTVIQLPEGYPQEMDGTRSTHRLLALAVAYRRERRRGTAWLARYASDKPRQNA